MPKQTFINLKIIKKKQITDAFLREFSLKSFDEASLTDVVKQLGIAKGSVYQYFDGKLDLYLYLIAECSTIKMSYFTELNRENHSNYWDYFRSMYEHGYLFDKENPLQSHFLFNLLNNLNSPSIKHLYDDMLIQAIGAFETMVQTEIKKNQFRSDIPIATMAFMLYKVGISIQEQLIFTEVIKPKESITKNESVYYGKKTSLMQTVDDYIRLVRPSFDKI
jgi:AcrR family transcriptional regulator